MPSRLTKEELEQLVHDLHERNQQSRRAMGLLGLFVLAMLAIAITFAIKHSTDTSQNRRIGALVQALCHGSNAARRQSNARAPLELDEGRAALVVALSSRQTRASGIHLDPKRIERELHMVHTVPLTGCVAGVAIGTHGHLSEPKLPTGKKPHHHRHHPRARQPTSEAPKAATNTSPQTFASPATASSPRTGGSASDQGGGGSGGGSPPGTAGQGNGQRQPAPPPPSQNPPPQNPPPRKPPPQNPPPTQPCVVQTNALGVKVCVPAVG